MNMQVKPPVVEQPKHRTITLTNRAPVSIVESDWPVIAEGGCGEDWCGPEMGWEIQVKVRRHINACDWQKRHDSLTSYIIHARYAYTNDGDQDQTVRVGRVLTGREAFSNLWKHISETGDELRARIANEHLRKHVVYAIDNCFANLAPQDMS
jgi:hypothetical protein